MIRFTFTACSRAPLSTEQGERLGRLLARALDLRSARVVGVACVSQARMRELNKQYRNTNRPTDVLSFAPSDAGVPRRAAPEDMGDLVLCLPVIRRQARERKSSIPEETVRLLAHGVLHLAGYDHADAASEARMFAVQEAVVRQCLKNV